MITLSNGSKYILRQIVIRPDDDFAEYSFVMSNEDVLGVGNTIEKPFSVTAMPEFEASISDRAVQKPSDRSVEEWIVANQPELSEGIVS